MSESAWDSAILRSPRPRPVSDATNANMSRALEKIGRLAAVKAPPLMIRVENFD